ncbi:Golgi apparatus protein 1 isoform X2 [Patella vulgata]|uniref:Golgi apparatus protein 1 isoform X2 n=1 Tax=Patella vulgata TaxID=6465 RepID=UPI002180309A|nr:Golgi apparatus protein 1 isoform X2 [Patella vulgata]
MAACRRRVVNELVVTILIISTILCDAKKDDIGMVKRNKRGVVNELRNKANEDLGKSKNLRKGGNNNFFNNAVNQFENNDQKNANSLNNRPLTRQKNIKSKNIMPPGQFRPNDQLVVGNNRGIQQMKTRQIKISESKACADDVTRFCHGNTNNFAVLDCLQNDLKMEDEVAAECQDFLWHYKRNLTKDNRFDSASKEVCQLELEKIPECSNLQAGSGFMIPCLIEHIENVTNKACQQYLAKMSSIVFSDYRLVYKFVENCETDIQTLQCGRLLDKKDEQALHNQGLTIDCLATRMGKLNPQCKKEVLRTLELQSDDYHLDRPLFYACRDDRESFCANVRSGGGRVYECLYKHIASKSMSRECREKLELRQQLISTDVKIDKAFFVACKKDIKDYKCMETASGDPDSTRADVLLCLESAIKNDDHVTGECVREMKEVRRNIMEDFNIIPEILSGCGNEIKKYCSETGIGGNTIHCLMALAIPNRMKNKTEEKILGSQCKAALNNLLEEVDVGSDYTLDKVLMRACESVVNTICSHVSHQDSSIMNCLMDNLDHDDMSDVCEERLLEIQYFIVRDFRLDHMLYKKCRKFAKNLCHTTGKWWVKSDKHLGLSHVYILSCLYRHMKQRRKQISRGCKHEIRRVLRQRAKSVDLEPEIQEKCVIDLSVHCSEGDDMKLGEEINCLQDNYDMLRPECKEAIGNFTEDEDEDYQMDALIMKSCTPMIKMFCADLLESDSEPTEVLECLIEHKNHQSMNSKCAAGIEHHQLISLKEFRFNHKFKELCQAAVTKLCKNKKTKLEVVSCLSEHVRNDTLLDNKHRIDKKCRKQLKVELLQRGESINLDPKLKKACHTEIEALCGGREAGNAEIIECLKSKQKKLSSDCHKLIFKREKDEFAIADYGIATACKRMIQIHCSIDDDNEIKIMDCLKKAKDDPSFDNNCRTIVLRRQIAQSNDYRLNPQLRKLCRQDIPKFCKDILKTQKNDEDLEGKVINCLKKQYAVKRLSKECSYEIYDRIKESARDIRLAPQLASICSAEIQAHCQDEVIAAGDEDEIKGGPGRIQECLKAKFLEKQLKNKQCIQEIALLIEENRVDINVDPLLNAACQNDIVHFCQGVKPGEGKIMSCLLATLEDSPKAMESKCFTLLKNRKEMWEYAAQIAPPESFQEVYEAISQSPAKAYFLGVLAAVVAIIFIVGISCGRVTKRLKAELKNR